MITVVARGGKVVHSKASGHQNVGAGEPMTEDTLFRMYSMTKPIASAGLMILWEEGHLLLSTPVAAILPEFADMQVYVSGSGADMVTEPARRPIIIRDLMTHTSGLTYSFIPSAVADLYTAQGLDGAADASPHDDLAHYVRDLAAQPLLVHPSTGWNYSVGLEVAGRVIEVVSGQTFREFLKERLFDPLGMVDTDFFVPDEKLDRFAVNYLPTPRRRHRGRGRSGDQRLPDRPEGRDGRLRPGRNGRRLPAVRPDARERRRTRRCAGARAPDRGADDGQPPGLGVRSVALVHAEPRHGDERGHGLRPGRVLDHRHRAHRTARLGRHLRLGRRRLDRLLGRPPSRNSLAWVLTQLLPTGTYPLRPTMEVLTYQAIVE